jgi:hypothetical protein
VWREKQVLNGGAMSFNMRKYGPLWGGGKPHVTRRSVGRADESGLVVFLSLFFWFVLHVLRLMRDKQAGSRPAGRYPSMLLNVRSKHFTI